MIRFDFETIYQLITSENTLTFLGMFLIAFFFILRRSLKGLQNRRSIQQEVRGVKRYASLRVNPKSQTASLLDDLTEKCASPLESLAVHTDFPRLARKFRIFKWQRPDKYSRLYDPVPELPPEHLLLNASTFDPPSQSAHASSHSLVTERLMQNILVLLCDRFHQDSTMVKEEFLLPSVHLHSPSTHPARVSSQSPFALSKSASYSHNMTKKTPTPLAASSPSSSSSSDLSESLLKFLTTKMGDAHPVVRLLKACNQSTIAPAAIRLKVDVGSKHPYKDKRGSWQIDIILVSPSPDQLDAAHPTGEVLPSSDQLLNDPQSSSEQPISEVIVRHSKRECSWAGEENPASHFEFTWHLHMAFNPTLEKLQAAQMQITDVYFNPQMPSNEQEEVLECLSTYMEHDDSS